MHKYSTAKLTEAQLQSYVGKYYSEELDCSYNIILKDHALVLTNAKYNDSKIDMEGPDHMVNENWWMDHLTVTRNSNGQITGFEINSNRVQHLLFNKIE